VHYCILHERRNFLLKHLTTTLRQQQTETGSEFKKVRNNPGLYSAARVGAELQNLCRIGTLTTVGACLGHLEFSFWKLRIPQLVQKFRKISVIKTVSKGLFEYIELVGLLQLCSRSHSRISSLLWTTGQRIMTKGSNTCRAVIEDWMTHFAACR